MAHPGEAIWISQLKLSQSWVDEFETPAADLFATQVKGQTWTRSLFVPIGTPVSLQSAKVEGGQAIQGPSGNGYGASLDSGGPLDLDIEVDYDNVDAASSRQSRVWARGIHDYVLPNRSEMPVMAIVRANGQVMYEPWVNPSTQAYQQLELGTGAPLSGKLRLRVLGDQASVYVNDVQVGASRTLDGHQLTGTRFGFAVYVSSKINRFQASTIVS